MEEKSEVIHEFNDQEMIQALKQNAEDKSHQKSTQIQ